MTRNAQEIGNYLVRPRKSRGQRLVQGVSKKAILEAEPLEIRAPFPNRKKYVLRVPTLLMRHSAYPYARRRTSC